MCGRVADRPRHSAPDEQVRVDPQRSGENPPEAPEGDTRTATDDDRGIVRGHLTYADGSPAHGLPVSLRYGHFKTPTDVDGGFRIDVPAGRHELYVGLLEIEKFELRPGQHHIADHVVPRGASVSGVVVAAEDGAPLGGGQLRLYGDRMLELAPVRNDGTFLFEWVPSGRYQIVVPESGLGHRAESVPFAVESTGIELRIEVPTAAPLPIRFKNLPAEWSRTIPMFIEIADEAGRRYTVRPSEHMEHNLGPSSTDLSATGRALDAPLTPARGKYVLRLIDGAWNIPYLETRFEIPCRENEITIDIPDGARVVVSQLREVTAHLWLLNGLVVGAAGARLHRDSSRVVLPRVPAGRQMIWKTNAWSVVKLGELDVPPSGDLTYVIDRELNAGVKGEEVWRREIQLLREDDEALVAWKQKGSPKFLFTPLRAGRYILVVDGQRTPISLSARQLIDLGDQLAR